MSPTRGMFLNSVDMWGRNWRQGRFAGNVDGDYFVTGLFSKFKEKVNETEGIGYC